MTQHERVHLEGSVSVELAPEAAFALFTPSGERRWAAGWDPWFPADGEEIAPGTVFRTSHSGNVTWVVVGCEPPRSITYAQVSEHDRAGLVRVVCERGDNGTTIAKVTYDITSLSDDGLTRLKAFAGHYEEFLDRWRCSIASALKASQPPPASTR
jgi:hypothetical protein